MHHFVNQKEAENLGSKDFVNKLDWIVYNSNWNFEKHAYQFKIPKNKLEKFFVSKSILL